MEAGEEMSVMIEYITEIGFDAIKDKIIDQKDALVVRNIIKDYLQRQEKMNFNCTKEEEVDFEGLANYIRCDLITDVQKRFWGNSKERGEAYRNVIAKAARYAKEETRISERRAKHIVSQAMNILADFYRKRINRDLLFIASEIEDTIIEATASQQNDTKGVLSKEFDCLTNAVENNSLLSVDKNLALIESGQINEVEKGISSFMNAISSKHDLFPHYGFRMGTKNKLLSFPLTEDATVLFPPRFDIEVSSVLLGDKKISTIDENLFKQSFMHQIPIYLDVVSAKKYLGDFLDPIQREANEMVGKHMTMKPPEFPEAFPCKVIIGDDVIVDYLLLRTKELRDDGAIVVTNDEQKDFNFGITLIFFPEFQKLEFTVSPSNPTNMESLVYRKFMKRALSGEKVNLKVLSNNENLVEGTLDNGLFEALEEEIVFLEKIVEIEKYFNVQINIPDEITIDDHKIINFLCDLLHGSYTGHWDCFEFKFNVTDEIKKRISELTEDNYFLECSCEMEILLFDHIFHLPILRQIKSAKVKDLERLKAKAEVLDIDDEIKISYISADKSGRGTYVDVIGSKEEEIKLLDNENVIALKT